MNGITINIDPIAFSIGHFSVGWYGIAIAVAILAAVMVALREGRRIGISNDDIYSLAFWGVFAGFIGARLFHVVDRWEVYSANPIDILAIQNGGLAIWGGVLGGAAAIAVVAKLKHLPLLRLTDGAVPVILTGQIIGRFGCIVNGDAWGGPTGLPWGFIYTNPGAMIPLNLMGIPTHPYPVYDMLWNIATLVLILRLRNRVKTPGLMSLSYISLYSVGRFFLTYVRQEEVFLWGLQEAQVISLFAVVLSVAAMMYLVRRRKPAVDTK